MATFDCRRATSSAGKPRRDRASPAVPITADSGGIGAAVLAPRRADPRRLRHAPRRNARREPFIEAEQLAADEDGGEATGRQEHRHGDLAQRAAVERAEELRPALVADRIDEEREHDALHARVDVHAKLADQHRRDERAAHATDLELAEVDLADRIADGERQEERRLRHALEYGMDEIHQRRSPKQATWKQRAHV